MQMPAKSIETNINPCIQIKTSTSELIVINKKFRARCEPKPIILGKTNKRAVVVVYRDCDRTAAAEVHAAGF